jgi:hypothetical protein
MLLKNQGKTKWLEEGYIVSKRIEGTFVTQMLRGKGVSLVQS